MNIELGTSLCFDDILMEPLLSSISTRKSISLETNIATNNRKLILKTPLIGSPMDTVTETDMAIKMALTGGLGIIHRYMSIDEQVLQVTKVKRFLQYIIKEPYKIIPDTNLYDIEVLRKSYNVSSFCVVDNYENNNLIGILTNRDIEYMIHCKSYYNQEYNEHLQEHIKYLTAGNFMTQTQKLITLDINTTNITNTINNNTNNTINITNITNTTNTNINTTNTNINTTINQNALLLLHFNLDSVLSIAKDLIHKNKIEKIPIVNGSFLIGLITLKNICHYENNKYKACIDSNGSLCVGGAIGIVDDYIERLDRLVSAGVDLICIDVANGFNTNIFNTISLIRAKYPLLVLMVGNVCNWQGYAALAQYDVDCIRIGVGNGSICTTRLETGIGKGQFSAVLECFRYKNDYDNININGRQYPNIICDGGSLGKTGNKVKALACGSSAIMLGRTLASTIESPGIIIHRNGKRFKYIRGMASTMANLSKQEKSSDSKETPVNKHSEGVDGEQELSGSVIDVIEQINGGLKSGMSYLGCETINQLHSKSSKGEIKFNLITSIGMSENGIRVKTY